MKRLEELNVSGLKIFQDDEGYCFTSDAILLSRFARVKNGDVIADFCSGSGVVGLHLYGLNADKEITSVTLFEKQERLYNLSCESIKLNNLCDVFKAENVRIQDIKGLDGKFSLIVCNPPYMEIGRGENQENEEIKICRAEVDLTLSELMNKISKCLKFGGRTAIVHRADRLSDVITEMRKNGIEPKRLQFISGKDKEPYLLLIEGVKGGKSGIKVLKTEIN